MLRAAFPLSSVEAYARSRATRGLPNDRLQARRRSVGQSRLFEREEGAISAYRARQVILRFPLCQFCFDFVAVVSRVFMRCSRLRSCDRLLHRE